MRVKKPVLKFELWGQKFLAAYSARIFWSRTNFETVFQFSGQEPTLDIFSISLEKKEAVQFFGPILILGVMALFGIAQ